MLLPNPLKNMGISGCLGTREVPRDYKRIRGGVFARDYVGNLRTKYPCMSKMRNGPVRTTY